MKNQILALANMINGGKKIKVVRTPDYNGGHFYIIEPADYKLQEFEYSEWEGSPAQLAEQNPTFTAHVEPLHEEPQDYEMSMLSILRYTLQL